MRRWKPHHRVATSHAANSLLRRAEDLGRLPSGFERARPPAADHVRRLEHARVLELVGAGAGELAGEGAEGGARRGREVGQPGGVPCSRRRRPGPRASSGPGRSRARRARRRGRSRPSPRARGPRGADRPPSGSAASSPRALGRERSRPRGRRRASAPARPAIRPAAPCTPRGVIGLRRAVDRRQDRDAGVRRRGRRCPGPWMRRSAARRSAVSVGSVRSVVARVRKASPKSRVAAV